MAVAFPTRSENEKSDNDEQPVMEVDKGRPNGSLHSRQKRKIADACEWLRLTQTRDKKAVIFCLTSPGFTSLANTPKFISGFIDNMKSNYGMRDYVWVREMTKRGYPHFHFVAHWHPSKWFLENTEVNASGVSVPKEPMIIKLSKYWSRKFNDGVNHYDAVNSIRLGSYHPKTKKRTFYLSTAKHAWYLTKYIGKSIGDGSMDYLAEAGFPSVKYKKAIRSFGMSEDVALLSQPELFHSHEVTVQTYDYESKPLKTTRKVSEVVGVQTSLIGSPVELRVDREVVEVEQPRPIERKERIFVNDATTLSESDLQVYDWRWTGHGETYIGFDKRR